jgi:hypothetical protein
MSITIIHAIKTDDISDNYGLEREVEDLDTIIKKTDAHYIFGGSSGGL